MMLRKKGEVLLDDGYDEVDDLIEGRRAYNIEEKISPKVFNDTRDVLKRKGREVSYESLHANGFTKPILVKDNDGLGIRMPNRYFSVKDVMKHVGSGRMVQVIDATTQATATWTMERFESYYNTPKPLRKRIWNVISLEFSGTKLDPLVTAPTVVRELDWALKAWPLDMLYVDVKNIANEEELTFPKVFKYCLMSVAGCYTDFHIDLGGTSVWYHILKGRKVFWLIPPTEENLQKFVEWSMSGEQEKTFLGDLCSACQRVTLQEGNTFFIPTGWIHAVYTPMDSLVFGGNFLHSLNVGLQLRVVAIEEKLRVPPPNRYPFFHEMQWYVYDHYNIALTAKSFMTADGQPVHEMCDIVEANPILSEYELSGLKNLREWLPNQDVDTYPDDMDSRQKLLDSMMVALVKHKNDFSKTHSPRKRSMLQWKQAVLDQHKARWYISLKDQPATSTPNPHHALKSPPPATPPVLKSPPPNEPSQSELSATEEEAMPSTVTEKESRVLSELCKRSAAAKGCVRRPRCNECKGCLLKLDCTRCIYCKDMKKFGGRGTLKQGCVKRKCVMYTNERFKVIADKDPKQRKLTSILISPATSKQEEAKSVTGGKTSGEVQIKVKAEPLSPAKDVLKTPARVSKKHSNVDSSPEVPSKRPSSSQKTLTQFYSPSTSAPSEELKQKKKRKRKSSFSLEDLGDGRHQTAAEFGHSEAHLQNLLKSADTSKLTINGGEVVIYRTDEGKIRVFVKDSCGGADVSTSAADNRAAEKNIAKRRKREETVEERDNVSVEAVLDKSAASLDKAASDSEGAGDMLPGVKLVPKLKMYLKNAAGEVRQGITVSNKLVFLCKAQTVDNNGGMMYIGYPMAVNSGTYFYDNAVKPLCKYVKIYDDGISVSLPLVFPKPKHLKKCMALTDVNVVARECSQYAANKTSSTAKAEVNVASPDDSTLPTTSRSSDGSNDSPPFPDDNFTPSPSPPSDSKAESHKPQPSTTESTTKPIRVVRIVHPDASSLAASSPISRAKMESMVRSGKANTDDKGTTSSVSMVNVFLPEKSNNDVGGSTGPEITESIARISFDKVVNSGVKSTETHIDETFSSSAVEEKTSGSSPQESHTEAVSQNHKVLSKVVANPNPQPTDATEKVLPAATSNTPQTSILLPKPKVFNKSIIAPKDSESTTRQPAKLAKVADSMATAPSSDGTSSDTASKPIKTIKLVAKETNSDASIPLTVVRISSAKSSVSEATGGQSASKAVPSVGIKSASTKLDVKSSNVKKVMPLAEKFIGKQVVVEELPSGADSLLKPVIISNAGKVLDFSEVGDLVQEEAVLVDPLELSTLRDSQTIDDMAEEQFSEEDSFDQEEIANYLDEFESDFEEMSDIDNDSDDIYFDSSGDDSSVDFMDIVAQRNHKSSTSDEDMDIGCHVSHSTTDHSPNRGESSSSATPGTAKKNGKRARACGECTACNAKDCRECVFCLDMKKYGGRGKMKQKCKEKQCLFMTRTKTEGGDAETSSKAPKSKPVTVTISPKFTLKPSGAKVVSMSLSKLEPKPTKLVKDVPAPKPISKPVAKPKSKPKPVARPKDVSAETSQSYNALIRMQASEIRKLPNCGECTNCVDKKEFGGPGKKKQMCMEKKSQLQQRVAKLTADTDQDGEEADSLGRPLHGRTSSRKRKLTQKMEESLDQEWNDVVKAKMLSMSDYASSLLDNYLESLQDASDEEGSDDSESVDESSAEDENSVDNLSYDLLNEFMDGMDDMLTDKPSQDTVDGTQEASTSEAMPARVSNSAAIEVSYNSEGQSCIDLTKMTIDQSMVEAVIQVQPEVLTINKAITSTKALRTLLSGCICCTQLSMKGVTAVAQLGLADLPFTLTHLILSGIAELKDQIFSSLIRKSGGDETFLGIQFLDLSYTGIGDNSLRLIARHLPVLATLNVNACSRITNNGVALLAYSKRLPSLKEIEMNDCEGIDGECLTPFTAHKGLVRLRSINLNGCPNISVNDIKSFVSSTQGFAVPWSSSRRHLTREFKRKG